MSFTNIITSGGVGSTVEISEIEELANGTIIIGDGTDAPTTLAAFTTATGTLKHESGGLEADVSAYSGFVKITGGATSAVAVTANGQSLITAADYAAMKALLDLEIGTDVQAQNATLAAVAAGTYTGDDSIATVGTVTAGNVDAVVSAASDSAAGKVELAIASEVTTGTDTARAVTPDAYAGSDFGKRVIETVVFAPTTDIATGDGKAYFTIPSTLNGFNLVRAQATVVTAGTTNATTIMIHNLTQTADMLSGAISIASAGVAGTVGTVDTGNDDVATDDRIRIDVDSVSSTAPKGLTVILEFQLP